MLHKILTFYKIAKNYSRQFNVLDTVKFSFIDLMNKILDDYSIYSYSQTGEDRIIHAIIEIYGKWEKADFSSCFYVDCGCNEPIKYSNTCDLYRRGWNGICIDANETLIKKFAKIRRKDVCVYAVVSNSKDELIFTEFIDSGVSSLDKDHVEQWKKQSQIISSKKVNPVSLNQILDKAQAPKSFALLTVDVEGHDFEVLQSIDLNTYHPTLIVVETTGYDIKNIHSSKIYDYLSSHGYKMIAFAIGNTYFLRS